jgi:transmembrane sensor
MDTRKNKEAPDPDSECERSIIEQAVLWLLLYMDEPAMSWSDRIRFVNWLRRSPHHVAAFISVYKLDGVLGRHKLRAVENNRTGQRWKVAAMAAGVVLSILLTIATREPRIDNVVSTAAGQHQDIELPDGSVTHVGTSSQVRIVFNGEQRIVHLYQGEAVFDVEKDPARPFTVITHLIDVTAVGTRFGVAKDVGVVATVSEGVVKITAHDNPDIAEVTLLRAGQQLRVSDNSLTPSQVAHLDATRALQWADGSLGFTAHQTIGEAVQEFNRHNVVQIEIEQSAIAAIELEGPYRYSIHSPATFARDVAANNGLVLLEDRTGKVTSLRLVERRTK